MFGKEYFNYPSHPCNENNRFITPIKWGSLAQSFHDMYITLVGSAPKTAIDCGCGKGYLVRELNTLGINTIGFDFSKYAVKEAVSKKVFLSTFSKWVKWNADLVIASGSLYYLTAKEAKSFIEKVDATVVVIENIPKGDSKEIKKAWLKNIEGSSYTALFKPIRWYIKQFTKKGYLLGEIVQDADSLNIAYYFVKAEKYKT